MTALKEFIRITNSHPILFVLQVVFSKSTFWKSKIETRAIADNKTKWLLWIDTAKKHLANKDAKQTATVTPPTSTPKSGRATGRQHSGGEHSSTTHEGSARRDSAQLSTRTTPKRRSSRASSSLRTKQQQQVVGQAVGSSPPSPSNSFILYLRGSWMRSAGMFFFHEVLTNIATYRAYVCVYSQCSRGSSCWGCSSS